MNGIVFNEPLILELNKPMTDRKVPSAMTDYSYEKGIVKDTYEQTVLEREQSFPTGSKIGGISVVIPHTDICHVNEAVTCVVVPKTPTPFRIMGRPGSDVPVSLVIMLALTGAHRHIEMFRRIVKLIQNQESIKHMVGAGQPDTIHKIIRQYLLEDEN